MPQKRKQYVKLADGTLEQQMLATSADIVEIEAITGITATDVQGALEELKDLADNGGVTSVNSKTGAVTLGKSDVGLGNVNNTSDANKPVSTAQAAAIKVVQDDVNAHEANKSNPHGVTKSQVGLGSVTNDAQVKRSEMGVASGVATLGTDGKVPTSQLPSYVDDTIEGYLYNSKFYKETAHTTQITGESGKIYVDLATNKTYRWSGSAFVEISASLALGTTSSTAYRGDLGAANATAITTLQGQMSTAQGDISDLETADGQNVKLTGDQQIDGKKVFKQEVMIKSGNGLVIGSSSDEFVKLNNDEGAEGTFCFPVNGSGTLATRADIPTKVSELTNDSGFTTNKGTVTSVTISAGTGISVNSSSAITSSGSRTISLSNSGVTAGTYSVVTVDAKGRATAGTQLIEWGTTGQTTPNNLAVGGLFFQMV